MPSYFPRALLFKEWKLARWYLVLGVLAFSLGPLQSFVWTFEPPVTRQPFLIEQNVTMVGIRGLGILVVVFAIGLAAVLLTEFYRNTGLQLAAEPISLGAVIVTKFLLGIIVIIVSQGATFLWVWGALSFRHAAVSNFLLYAWCLTGVVLALSFFSVTFMAILLVRPIAVGLLLMIAAIATPAMLSQWFLIPWRHPVPGGGYEMHLPLWALHVYHIIQYGSPYEIFHHDIQFLMRTPAAFTWHAVEPLGWLIIAILVSLWTAYRSNSIVEVPLGRKSRSYRSRFGPWAVRGLSTLGGAVVIEHYFLNTTIHQIKAKLVVILFLWFACYWLLRAFLGYRETRGNNTRRLSRKLFSAKGGHQG